MQKPLAAAVAAFHVMLPVLSFAQPSEPERVLVSASRGIGGVRTDLLGSSYSVIESLDLRNRQTVYVSDVLRDIPGIAVSRQGTVGGFTQVRMRGGESNHTYTMIDGIEASEPFSGEFDFSSLLADGGAKIEVLRGQQSALYGSNAMGGIIHYITLSGAEAPGVRTSLEGGSFDTLSGSVRAAGVAGALDYVLNASASRTSGINGVPNGIRHNGAKNQNFSGKFVYSLAENLLVTAVGRFSNGSSESTPQSFSGANFGMAYDTLPGNPAVQVRNATEVQNLYGLLRADLSLLDGSWTHSLTLQGVESDRKNYGETYNLSSVNYGTREKVSYVTAFSFAAADTAHTLTFAADLKRERYQNKAVGGAPTATNAQRQLDNAGFAGQYDVSIGEKIGIGAALRHDINQHFKNGTTYRVQASYRVLPPLRLRAAAGSAITNPTNIELFGFNPTTFTGNPNLKPERSQGWETGFDYSVLEGRAFVGATYFYTRFTDEIFTAFTPSFISTPENRTSKSTQQGVEVWIGARIAEQWRVDASWTNLHALESNPGLQEIRRPPNIASLNVAWRSMDDKFGANLTVRYNGEQRDFLFTPTATIRAPLKAYTLLNLGADYRLNENWQIYGRIENLLNQRYQELIGFAAPGVAVYGGIRARFS